jgi:heme/copper-type cytochrome/quinol oxidase subunit 3
MFTFYLLTGLHALHVIGGMVLLGAVTAKAFAGRYSATYHPGVTYAAMYWHFLDVVWLVMFVLIFLI